MDLATIVVGAFQTTFNFVTLLMEGPFEMTYGGLITMVILSPLFLGQCGTQFHSWPKFMAEKNGVVIR